MKVKSERNSIVVRIYKDDYKFFDVKKDDELHFYDENNKSILKGKVLLVGDDTIYLDIY